MRVWSVRPPGGGPAARRRDADEQGRGNRPQDRRARPEASRVPRHPRRQIWGHR